MQAIAEMQAITESQSQSRPQNFVEDLLKTVISSLEDNKAEDIVTISLSGKSSMADYMVIASGRSARQVAALTDYVVRALKESGQKDLVIQGLSQADWVLIDAGDILVHIFRPEVRDFYNLDKMWLLDSADSSETDAVKAD